MMRLARCNLPYATTSRSGRSLRAELVEQCPDFHKLAPHLLQSRLQGLPRGDGSARIAGRIGYRIERKQRRRGVLLDRPPRGRFAPRTTLAEQLLDPADRISFLIKELSDLPQQFNVLRPIVTAATPALERLNLRKFGFPKSQHMRRQFEFLGDFSGGAKGSARFAGAPMGCWFVRLGHLTPRVPRPQMQRACHHRPHRSDPD